MALPTKPHIPGSDPEGDFLRNVMGVGETKPEHNTPGSTAPASSEQESVFAGTTTIDEILEVFEENDEMVREREEEKTWQELQPRVQEYTNRKVLWWVLLSIAAVATAVYGAWFLVSHFQAAPEPVVIQQDSGYQVPEELVTG